MPLKPSFRDSETFQSLHKIAAEKGLLPPAPKTLVKEAASKLPTPPASLTEKILVLCEGLREQGFHKYANEVENKFLLLTKAELHLYNTTGEEGKDLVEFAHQEGGKKLDKDWDDLGVVETITERQNKILDVVRKQPTGKQASKNIINAVKVALGQASDLDALYTTAIKALSDFRRFYNAMAGEAIGESYSEDHSYKQGIGIGSAKDVFESDLATLNDKKVYEQEGLENSLSAMLENFLTEQQPEIWESVTNPSAQRTWDNKVVPQSIVAKKYADKFKEAVSQIRKIEISNQQESALKDLEEKPAAEKPAQSVSTPPAPAQSSSSTPSDVLSKISQDKEQASEVANQISTLAEKPSVSGNEARAKFMSGLSAAVKNYIADLDIIAGHLQTDPKDFAKAVEGTKLFSNVTSYDDFKAKAGNFHNAVNQRLQTVVKW